MEKTALDDAGSWHILSFEKKYAQLQELCPNIHILKPEMGGDGRSVRFEFLAGVTLAEKLGRHQHTAFQNCRRMDRDTGFRGE